MEFAEIIKTLFRFIQSYRGKNPPPPPPPRLDRVKVGTITEISLRLIQSCLNIWQLESNFSLTSNCSYSTEKKILLNFACEGQTEPLLRFSVRQINQNYYYNTLSFQPNAVIKIRKVPGLICLEGNRYLLSMIVSSSTSCDRLNKEILPLHISSYLLDGYRATIIVRLIPGLKPARGSSNFYFRRMVIHCSDWRINSNGNSNVSEVAQERASYIFFSINQPQDQDPLYPCCSHFFLPGAEFFAFRFFTNGCN